MTNNPQVWHYGLMARWWAEFNIEGPEIDFFKALIDQYGQPALDVACGTGRLLIPFLHAVWMLTGATYPRTCSRYVAKGPRRKDSRRASYNQPMHELALPRKYKSIVVCGGFGLGGFRQQDQEALNRFFKHLEPGGALLLDNYLPYKDADIWRYWVKEEWHKLPEAWPTSGTRKRAENGEEMELKVRLAALDPLDQVATWQTRVILWHDGLIVKQEDYTLLERFYFRKRTPGHARHRGVSRHRCPWRLYRRQSVP